MADYWGLKRIANRMGYKSERAILNMIIRRGFPAYLRPHRPNPNPFYYCNDELIYIWEITQAKLTREKLLKREEQKKIRKGIKEEGDFKAL